jgi:hypothetical protein
LQITSRNANGFGVERVRNYEELFNHPNPIGSVPGGLQ